MIIINCTVSYLAEVAATKCNQRQCEVENEK